MKIYKIGYSTMEESNYSELQHEDTFTKDQITEMIAEGIIDLLKKDKKLYIHNFQSIMGGVLTYLIEEKGFKKIEYDLIWNTFGWPSLFDNEDWKSERDEQLIKIAEILNKNGYNKKRDSFYQSRKYLEEENKENE